MAQQYERFDEIGHGRFSVVYSGYDHTFGRDVAIRELPEKSRKIPGLFDAFLAEARSLAGLDHAGFLKVLDMDQGQAWVISELMGGSLAQHVEREGAMSPDRVRSVLQQTLRALDYLHEHDVQYGQVRPSKILYNDRGRVKLGYFQGIRGGVAPVPEHNKYAAPETLVKSFGPLGPQLDLYCLAFTVLELLLGADFQKLFPIVEGDNAATSKDWLRWHSSPQQVLPPARKVIPKIPADLATAIDAALKKNVADRPRTAREMLALLEDRAIVAVVEGGMDSISGGQLLAAEESFKSDPPAPPPAAAPSKPAVGVKSPAAKPPAAATASKPKPAPAAATTKPRPRKSRLPLVLLLLLLLTGGGLAGGYFAVPQFRAAVDGLIADLLGTPQQQIARVTFEYDPPQQDVAITLAGKPFPREPDGVYLIAAGEWELTFTPKDVPPHTEKVKVAGESLRQKIAFPLAVAPPPDVEPPAPEPTPPTPKMIAAALKVDPRDATVLIDDEEQAADESGTVPLSLPEDRVGKPVPYKVSREHFAPVEGSFLLPAEQSGESVPTIRLSPLVTVSPEGAAISVDGQPVAADAEGQFALPRAGESFRLEVAMAGRKPFVVEAMTLEDLEARDYTIDLTEDADYYLQQARDAYSGGDLPGAHAAYTTALEIDSDLGAAWLERGRVSVDLGKTSSSESQQNFAAAVEDLSVFLDRPDAAEQSPLALHLRGQSRLGLDDLDGAIDDLAASLERKADPAVQRELAAACFRRGELHHSHEEWLPAIEDLLKAKELKSTAGNLNSLLAESAYHHGVEQLQAEDLAGALKSFDLSIQAKRDVAVVYFERARAHQLLRNLDQAYADLSEAIRLKQDPEYLLARARLQRVRKGDKEALPEYDATIKADPGLAVAYAERGHIHRELGGFEAAVRDFDEAIQTGYDPSWEMQVAAIDCLLTFGDQRVRGNGVAAASTAFDSAVERLTNLSGSGDVPADDVSRRLVDAYRGRGNVAYLRKNYAEAIGEYTTAIEESQSKDADAFLYRAKAHQASKQFDSSEQDYRTVLRMRPTDESALYQLAEVLTIRGEETRNEANRRGLMGDEKKAAYDAAVAHYKEAAASLERLLKKSPDDLRSRTLLKGVYAGWMLIEYDAPQLRARRDENDRQIERLTKK